MVSKENKKLAGILCSVVILLSCIVGVEVFVSSDATVKADGFTSIDLRVTPSNSLFKLGVNESVTFTAQALNGTGPFSYSWVVTGSSSFSLLINDVLVDVKEGLSLDFAGDSLTVCYPKATEEFISVTCHVTDKNGFVGCLLQPFIVADPYTSPGYYFDAASSTATYIVQTDGLGWYRIIRGYTGAVTTYSNPNDALTAAFSGCSGAGSVYVCAGDYNGASATVLTGTQLVLEKGVSSLTYSCDTGATCMIIDYASGLFRYYGSGALTAEVNWASGTTNLAPNWQGTWNTTVLSIIQSNTLTSLSLSGNVTANNFESTHPMGAYSYMIYQDADFSSNGLYHAKAANGTICFTSTNKTSVLVSVADAASFGDKVVALSGIFGTKDCSLYAGNVTATLNSGEVAYQSSENQYAQASASANNTIGYGFVWLNTFDVVANDNGLFMENGIFTLGTWSLTAGLVWVSTTGTVTSTYPSSTGNQLCSVGRSVNATTIEFTNPHGEYGEHI